MASTDKRKQSQHFADDMLNEIMTEALGGRANPASDGRLKTGQRI